MRYKEMTELMEDEQCKSKSPFLNNFTIFAILDTSLSSTTDSSTHAYVEQFTYRTAFGTGEFILFLDIGFKSWSM